MYKDIFIQAGLTANEAIVYEFLLKNGEASAGQIIEKTPLKRGVAYNALAELLKKGLILEKKKPIAKFFPNHPEKLRENIENQENQIKKAKNTLDANIQTIISDFNLISGQPGVRYFEGMEGIKKVMEDSLTSKTTIRTYADIEAIVKYVDKINKNYVKKRNKLGIKKRAILIDSPFGRDYLKNYHRETTDMRFIDHKLFPFESVMQIYDKKISYITLSEKSMVGVIIQDPAIYQMHKSIFEHSWAASKSFDQLPALSKAQ